MRGLLSGLEALRDDVRSLGEECALMKSILEGNRQAGGDGDIGVNLRRTAGVVTLTLM